MGIKAYHFYPDASVASPHFVHCDLSVAAQSHFSSSFVNILHGYLGTIKYKMYVNIFIGALK